MFIIKEVFKIISRAKLHFFLNLVSLTISIILLTITLIIFFGSEAFNKFLNENISLTIFLEDDISSERKDEIERIIKSKPYTFKSEYISKEKAYEIFLDETGEDFKKILETNPLPASFNIYLNNDYLNKESLNKIITEISELSGVSEVISKMDFYQTLLNTTSKLKDYLLVITFIMIITSVYLVFSTNKLIINSNSEKYETMKLVGAKLSTIKAPIILNIISVGFIAGLLSLGFFYLLESSLKVDLNLVLKYFNLERTLIFTFIIFVGPLLGFITTLLSLKGITLKIKT